MVRARSAGNQGDAGLSAVVGGLGTGVPERESPS